jgi:hypothetical protein
MLLGSDACATAGPTGQTHSAETRSRVTVKSLLQQSCKKVAGIGQHHPEDAASVVLWARLVVAVRFVTAGGYAKDVLCRGVGHGGFHSNRSAKFQCGARFRVLAPGASTASTRVSEGCTGGPTAYWRTRNEDAHVATQSGSRDAHNGQGRLIR